MLISNNTAELSFELISEIGHDGKNSTVYKATDLQLNAEIAVKRIEKKKFDDINQYFKEARLLHISNHPNVVPVHYGCQDKDYIYIVMPYYKNGSLKQKILSQPLTIRQIITYTTQILSGLHNIHSKGLIHFDIKPDNILLSERDEAMLSDFGLAKQCSYAGIAQQDRVYSKMTPPEVFTTQNFNHQFDIYQVGLTIHRMSVGNEHFNNEFNSLFDTKGFDRNIFKEAINNGLFPNTSNYPEHFPVKLIKTIQKCLKKDVNDRYKSAIEITNDIANFNENVFDWQFTTDSDSRCWIKKFDDGKKISLIMKSNGYADAKKTLASGKAQTISKYSNKILGQNELKAFFKEY